MTYLEEYHELIKHREVIVGEWIEKEVCNLIEDLQKPLYIYDTTVAHKRIKFQETLCLQEKQPYYMKPLVLMPWQKAYWEALYSFRLADSKLRRFTETLLEVARKNGKSVMFAADGTTDLFVGEGGSSICCASNDDKQCKIIWDEIAGMRSRLDPKCLISGKNLTKVYNKVKDINVFRLSSHSKSLDGFNISKTYMDESHDLNKDDLPEACWRGMSVKDEPLFMNCTTQGFIWDGYLDRKIQHAKAVIDGIKEDINFLPFLYEQDCEQEIWQDEASWEKSNPSIRYGIKKIEKLRRDVELARSDNVSRIHLLCKDFNIKMNSSSGWLSDADFAYSMPIVDIEEWRNCYCIAAVDLAETTDLSNCKLMFKREGDPIIYVYSHYWLPESKLTESSDEAAGANYKQWAQDGYVTITDGTITDNTVIADWLADLKAKYNIKVFVCGYDQRFSKDFLTRMDDYGIQTEMIQQTAGVMSTPMKWVEAELKKHHINYGNNPVDKWCFANACIKPDNLGRCMCVKPQGNAAKRIDGAVTMIILFATYQRFQAEFDRYIA